jgi:phenylacetate-CoA ligase
MKRAFSRKNLWERAPAPVRAAAGRVFGLVPPAYLIGRRFREQLRFLEQAQWWPAERAATYQLEQVRRICALAYERTAYYRRLFDEAGVDPRVLTFERLRNLPTLTSDIVRDRIDDMCAQPPTSRGVDYITTGGTGGKPTRFYIDASRSQIEYAYLVSAWRRADFTLGTPLVVFRGRVVARDATGLYYEYDRALRQHYYSAFHMTDEQMRRAIAHIARLGPTFLHAYPSAAATLARFLQRANIAAPRNVLGVLLESENVYPDQRTMIEGTFHRRCFASYGMTEKVASAAECEHTTDYHVWPTYSYVELLDGDGGAITTPGESGEIVGTGFINTVVPFIRYRTGDFAIYRGERCAACGREHLILSDIRGHNIQEMLVTTDGSLMPWSALNMHDDTFDRVQRFQFYQDTPGQAVLRLVPAATFTDADVTTIRQRMARKIDGRFEFDVQLVDSITLSPRGKAIFVDQRITDLSP